MSVTYRHRRLSERTRADLERWTPFALSLVALVLALLSLALSVTS